MNKASKSLLRGITSIGEQIQALGEYLRGPEFQRGKAIEKEHRGHITDITFQLFDAITEVRDAIDSLEVKGAQNAGVLSTTIISMTSGVVTIVTKYKDIKEQIAKPNRHVSKTHTTLLGYTETMSEAHQELIDQHPRLQKTIDRLSIDQLSTE